MVGILLIILVTMVGNTADNSRYSGGNTADNSANPAHHTGNRRADCLAHLRTVS